MLTSLIPFLLLLIPPSSVWGQAPESSITKFPHLPSRMYYFEDTEVVLYHDPMLQNVWRSANEGKDWAKIPVVPEGEAAQLIEHPFDNEVAFVLTRGTSGKTTHYVSYNRGETWQSFEVETAPTLSGPALAFHATEKDWIMYQGTVCEDTGTGRWGSGKSCWDETWATQDAFRTPAQSLLTQTSKCLFAHSTKNFAPPTPLLTNPLIFCIAFDQSTKPGDAHSLRESRLFASKDWFKTREVVDMGVGRQARGVVGLGVVSKFVLVAVKVDALGGSGSGAGGDPMHMYVTVDGENWSQTKFPHSSVVGLKENAYTIVESTTHSLAIDVLAHPAASIGDLFVSNSNGTDFIISLPDTNRNDRGIVDYENLVGLEGVGVANYVSNREEAVGWGETKKIKSVITYDDGRSWSLLVPPEKDINGDDWPCQYAPDSKDCSLHLHSVSTPHNYGRVFSSTAPGFVMGVGSVGSSLAAYDDSDTFLSTDAGVTWTQAGKEARKYEFGDQGSILVTVNDEGFTDSVSFSYDSGKTWNDYNFGISLRALLLTTVPDSTSQKFLLLGTLSRKDSSKDGRHALVFLDFAPVRKRKCTDADFERWDARPAGEECLMGHKQYYLRRKADADCYVGDKFKDPVAKEENCPCSDKDFECDFNFILQDGECVLAGPEPVPAGVCEKDTDKYEGSSGYRLIPGNTCDRTRGKQKDAKETKDCSQAKPKNGAVSHATHDFGSMVLNHVYMGDSSAILVQLMDSSIWQSSNEGFTWKRLYENEKFLAFAVHAYDKYRAYLITNNNKVYFTTDTGKSWNTFTPPDEPNGLGVPIFDFHPTQPNWIIWTGQKDCQTATSNTCRAVSSYTTDHGKSWRPVDTYVKTCSWARDSRLKIDERMIICETFKNKEGSQRSREYNPLELIAGQQYYSKKQTLFPSVVGFATFSEYLIVAQLDEGKGTLSLQVSLDGLHFAEGQFPPGMNIENKAYTILESSTDSVFLHMTTSSVTGAEYGSLFKSNSNGTYYGLSIEHVNRNRRGYVDFEKMIGLDGIALINVVSNPDEAAINGRKQLQSRISHNDGESNFILSHSQSDRNTDPVVVLGGTWKPLTPPAQDSLGQPYPCSTTSCNLHIHGYTERRDPRATFSSPSAVGLMLGVGSVGEELAGYTDSDTFLTRDAGFTWQEVHKDAHLWEFGDYGSILVLANDEDATDHVIYTTDEGLTWKEYGFGDMIFVKSIQTLPTDSSRKFILFGSKPSKPDSTVAIHLDFTGITNRKCEEKIEDPNHDDFELWSPSEGREETCLFGRQVLYHRRVRDRDCYIGDSLDRQGLEQVQRNCTCAASDFECEFNYYPNANGVCTLYQGAVPLSSNTQDEQCVNGAEFWYERTNVRKIPYSSCEGGDRPDRGKQHTCPYTYVGTKSHLFWWTVILVPFAFAGLAALWWHKKNSGAIRLGESRAFGGDGPLDVVMSVPYFLIGAAGAGWAWLESRLPSLPFADKFRTRTGYRNVPVDDDAEILQGAYEDD